MAAEKRKNDLKYICKWDSYVNDMLQSGNISQGAVYDIHGNQLATSSNDFNPTKEELSNLLKTIQCPSICRYVMRSILYKELGFNGVIFCQVLVANPAQSPSCFKRCLILLYFSTVNQSNQRLPGLTLTLEGELPYRNIVTCTCFKCISMPTIAHWENSHGITLQSGLD